MFRRIRQLLSFIEPSTLRRIKSPFEGNVLPPSLIKNTIISCNVIGPSVAVNPTSDTVRAPCNGIIKTISEKHNALILEVGKTQLLINAGLNPKKYPDTLFDIKVREGDSVTTGMPLLSFNLDTLNQVDPCFTCVITVRQVKTLRSFSFTSSKKVYFDTVLFRLNTN